VAGDWPLSLASQCVTVAGDWPLSLASQCVTVAGDWPLSLASQCVTVAGDWPLSFSLAPQSKADYTTWGSTTCNLRHMFLGPSDGILHAFLHSVLTLISQSDSQIAVTCSVM
jgi:hypothetical protein